MRVALVSPYDLSQVGGVQQIVVELGRRLADRGEDVVVVGPGSGPPDLQTRSVGPSLSVQANRSAVPLSPDPRAFGATRRAVSDAEVVHVHEPFVPWVGWAAATSDLPVVTTFHADPARWTRALYRAASTLGRRVVEGTVVTAVSEVAASALPPEWQAPTIIPNALDTAAYRVDTERRSGRVTFLGRNDPRKGRAVLLEAWESVVDTHPDAELVVMGSNGRSGKRVVYTGRVSDEEKRATLASASIHVASNLGSESFGLVVAEGMAAGCAVVASDLPAFRAVLGDAGRLVPPGRPGPLADEIVALMSEPELAAGLGERARREVARFDWDVVLDAYLDAYRRAHS